MLVLKILDVFLPAAISSGGELCDSMEPPYIGFITEVLQARAWDGKVIPDSRFVGTCHTILEKSTREAARLHKGDIVSVADGILTQGLLGLSMEQWLEQPHLVVNNYASPILKPCEL